jgi:hypothetical protein
MCKTRARCENLYIGPLSHGTLQHHRWITTPFFKVHGSVQRNNILIYIEQDAKLHSSFYLESPLHVSGATTHHQERKQLYLQHLVFVTPLLLSAAVVEGLELLCISNSSTIAAGTSNGVTNTRCRRYSCLRT